MTSYVNPKTNYEYLLFDSELKYSLDNFILFERKQLSMDYVA